MQQRCEALTLTSRDTETLGCDPSLSSIPVRDQRSFADALAEVAAWLAAPGRAREELLIYLDDQPDLLDWVRSSRRRAPQPCTRCGGCWCNAYSVGQAYHWHGDAVHCGSVTERATFCAHAGCVQARHMWNFYACPHLLQDATSRVWETG